MSYPLIAHDPGKWLGIFQDGAFEIGLDLVGLDACFQ